ncbi:hypothetical protein QBC44DRAFT_337873 [Cladorrhinum sp. PSN332]|nr:hypothetical protein QBC44DRAFT_337873 [Cladorrhinum sp. PSN332]
MPSPTQQPLRILISGFGIAGPAFALSLTHLLPPTFPLSILIVERSPHLRNLGQQIDIRGQGLAAMRSISPTLEAAIRKRLVKEPGLEFIDYRTGKRNAYLGANDSGKGAQSFSAEWEIMRGSLVDALKEELEAVKAKHQGIDWKFNTWVEGFTQPEGASEEEEGGPVKVKFNNGQEQEFDLVVGADGVGSKTRRLLFGSDNEHEGGTVELKNVGATMALFSVPPDRQNDGPDARWCNLPGRRVIITRRDSKDSLRVCLMFLGDDAQIQETLKSGSNGNAEEQKQAWANKFYDPSSPDTGTHWLSHRFIHALLHSPDFSSDFWAQELIQVKASAWSNKQRNVVLLGDAAHCPSVLTGAGTTSAFIGAYVLSNELAKALLTTTSSSPNSNASPYASQISLALKKYDQTFRPFATYIQSILPPPSLLKTFIPQTTFGIRILNNFLWVLLTVLRIDRIVAYLARFFSSPSSPLGDNYGKWELPKY